MISRHISSGVWSHHRLRFIPFIGGLRTVSPQFSELADDGAVQASLLGGKLAATMPAPQRPNLPSTIWAAGLAKWRTAHLPCRFGPGNIAIFIC